LAFGKDDQERLRECFAYLKTMNVSQGKIDLLSTWVYKDGPFAQDSVSKALSLGFGVFNRHGTSKDTRQAIRTVILARMAVDTPQQASLSGTASSWKTSYQTKTETQLQADIHTYMNRLMPPIMVAPVQPKNVNPGNYGVTLGALNNAKAGLKAVAPKNATPPVVKPGSGANFAAKKDFFETTSRIHVILSGHGSWMYEPGLGSWPFVNLGPQQMINYYIDHYYPLGNDAGQMVDSRRFPAAWETAGPGDQICDYTLQPKDTLVLLNKGGGNGDQHFETVTQNTKLSTFLANPKYASATFHWAACRVVFNEIGQLECPSHGGWEDFNAACVLHQPHP
jgi:hypothetical protein